MKKHFAILGRQPELSLAEIASVAPKTKLLGLAQNMAVFDDKFLSDGKMMQTLGGTVKMGEIFLEGEAGEIDAKIIAKKIAANRPKTDSKACDFGLTVFCNSTTLKKKLFKLPIALKKELRAMGFSVRWVTGKNGEDLTPAAVDKCKLTDGKNADICIWLDEKKYMAGRTTQVQNADAWSLRDFGRPVRDDVNGMLPPKLARMMVNLAMMPAGGTILDPFCGSGTVLMEAALKDGRATILGADIEAGQINGTERNIQWLVDQDMIELDQANAMDFKKIDARKSRDWIRPKTLDAMVSEGWLGQPLKGKEDQNILQQNAGAVSSLWIQTLQAIKPLLKDDGRIVMILPEYKTWRGTAAAEIKDNLSDLGYKAIKPAEKFGLDSDEFLYKRPQQFVGRKIMVLVKSAS